MSHRALMIVDLFYHSAADPDTNYEVSGCRTGCMPQSSSVHLTKNLVCAEDPA